METIEIHNLTKDYGQKRGVFDLSLTIKQGEMMGFVGTNGSGKTTTIRSLMGFIKPTSGHAYIEGLETWQHPSEVARYVGYVPGEIAFPDFANGTAFLKSQAEFLHLKDLSFANELVEKLQLDVKANLKRMSKGMKQKTALVAALMNDPKILLLDEPTTGLDPLMRVAFMAIVKEEHLRGKTILMSSQVFNEMEETCDRVALISDGRLLDVADLNSIRNRPDKEFKIEFKTPEDYVRFLAQGFKIVRVQEVYDQVTVTIASDSIGTLFSALAAYDVKFISEVKYTLETRFKETLLKEAQEKEA
jgi:ABC-2 type transport system ATP-binding protein